MPAPSHTQDRLIHGPALHHFISVVALTFPSAHFRASRELWTVHAVRLAFQHRFLLHAIFANAALHLVRRLPTSPRFSGALSDTDEFSHLTHAEDSFAGVDLVATYHLYLDQAIKEQREAVTNINPGNANALMLASILISYQGLKLLPSEPGATNYDIPIQWLHMTRGITNMSDFAFRFAGPKPITDIMARIGGEPDFRDRDAIFDPAHREPFRELFSFQSSELGPDTREAYEMALSYVGRLYRSIRVKDDPHVIFRLVLCFPAIMPAQFLRFAEERQPRALAILAHYFAMAKAVDDHWVFAGLVDREVPGIRGKLPESWQWAMKWPTDLLDELSSGS
jgi:hypothetical protein